jgi:hypothetical protein
MKKIYLFIIACLCIIPCARAQSRNNISLSFGPELGIPFNTTTFDYGAVRDNYQDGVGGSVKVELPVATSLHLTGSAGYMYYPTNEHFYFLGTTANLTPYTTENDNQPPSYKFIPLKAGLQYYYAKYFYLAGDAGAAIKANPAALTSFIYSGGLGALIPFNEHNGLNIDVRYERGFKIVDYPSAMSQIVFRLAYRFGL